MDKLIDKGLTAKRESKYVEFKEQFDTGSKSAWCEIIKDIIALSNTGGGVLVFGLDNVGRPVGSDVQNIIDLDPADLTNKIEKYTGIQFSEFSILEKQKEGEQIAVIRVFPRRTPIVFKKPGTYPVEGGKQKTAFSLGTVYFRHGAKSEPGVTEDLRTVIRKRVHEMRQDLLSGVKKVINSSPGSVVSVLPGKIVESDESDAMKIRLVDDEDALTYRKIDRDITHPFRQKELIIEVNKKLPNGVKINQYDILSVRKTHQIDEKESFCYSPKFSSRQYSPLFAKWLASEFEKNPDFFNEARAQYLQMRR